MKAYYIVLLIMISLNSKVQAQFTTNVDLFGEYSKEVSVYKGKKFLISNLLKSDSDVKKLEIFALSAAQSGELTTLIYRSEDDELEGLLLGFYGNYWNEAGVIHKGYGFKYLDTSKALDFLYTIRRNLDAQKDYFKGSDNNNVYFKYDDITILATGSTVGGYVLRLFWQNFDSEWESGSFNRTIKRFEKRLNQFNK